jgi:hypothetical protein
MKVSRNLKPSISCDSNRNCKVELISKSGTNRGEKINKSMVGGEKGMPSYLILYAGVDWAEWNDPYCKVIENVSWL